MKLKADLTMFQKLSFSSSTSCAKIVKANKRTNTKRPQSERSKCNHNYCQFHLNYFGLGPPCTHQILWWLYYRRTLDHFCWVFLLSLHKYTRWKWEGKKIWRTKKKKFWKFFSIVLIKCYMGTVFENQWKYCEESLHHEWTKVA